STKGAQQKEGTMPQKLTLTIVGAVEDAFPGQPLPDDFEWGHERLRNFLADCPYMQAAHENLLADMADGTSFWPGPPPPWTKLEPGSYELKTQFGTLTVRRQVGWVAHLDGAPLVWVVGDPIIVFDKLKDAQTCALLHLLDGVIDPPRDGALWAR